MKKLLIVITFLITTILALKYAYSGHLDFTSLTLISMGLVLFVGFTLAELGKIIGFPMVTGFILTGLALGPEIGNIFSIEVVARLKMFNMLAIGIIALSAGIELDLKGIGKNIKSLFSTIGLKILFLALFVTPSVYFFESKFSLLGLSTKENLVVALLFFTFCIGTSPAIVLAVLNETKAKGRIANLVLSNAILKDFVVVIVLAIILAVCTSILGGQPISKDAIINDVSREIGLSLLAGMAIGLIIIAYLKYINFENLLFFISLIIVVAEVSKSYHLEFLLVLISAGAVVRNTTDLGDEMHHILSKVALPVFVLFFTNAGAAVQLKETFSILPLALVIFFVRMISIYLASRFSSKLTSEREIVTKNIWMGYIPQAGVTMGLVEIACYKIPNLAPQLQLLGMGLISLNLIAGPIFFKFALAKGKEIPEEDLEESKKEITSSIELDVKHSKSNFPRMEMEKNELSDEFSQIEAIVNNISSREFKKELENFLQDSLFKTRSIWKNEIDSLEQFCKHFDEHLKIISENSDRASSVVQFNKNIENYFNIWNYKFSKAINGVNKEILKTVNKSSNRLSVQVERKKYFGGISNILVKIPFKTLVKSYLYPSILSGSFKAHDYLRKLHHNQSYDYFNETWKNDKHLPLEVTIDSEKIYFSFVYKEVIEDLKILIREVDHYVKHGKWHGKIRKLSNVMQKTNAIKNEYENEIKYWEKASVAVKDTLCANNNLQFSKYEVEMIVKDVLFEEIYSFQKDVKEKSSKIFITIENLRKLYQEFELGNVGQKTLKEHVAEFEKNDFQTPVGTINPYIVEQDIKVKLWEIEHNLYKTSCDFVIEEGKKYYYRHDLVIKNSDFVSVFRQVKLLGLLPQLEEQIEELYLLFEHILNDQVESIGQLKAIFMGLEEMKVENIPAAISHLDAIKKKYSHDIKILDQNITECIHLCTVTINNSFEQLKQKHQSNILTNRTLKGVNLILEQSEYFLKKAIPELKNVVKEVIENVTNETAVLHTPDKIIYNRQRLRAVNKHIKEVADKLALYTDDKNVSKLPEFYRECFTLEPIRASNNMVVHSEIHHKILELERNWQEKGGNFFVLIAGGTGSGKTSLLNILQNELESHTVYRINDEYERKCQGILNAVSRIFNKKDKMRVILCDDIDQWSQKSIYGHEEFKKFVDVYSSHYEKNTLWIFTANTNNLYYLNSTFNFDLITSRTYYLKPLSTNNAYDVIGHRQWESGNQLVLERGWGNKLFSDNYLMKSMLDKMLEYNTDLHTLINHWLLNVHVTEQKSILEMSDFKTFSFKEDFTNFLPTDVYVVLRYLVHYGESSIVELERNTKLDRNQITRCLNYLKNLNAVSFSQSMNKFGINNVIRSLISPLFQRIIYSEDT